MVKTAAAYVVAYVMIVGGVALALGLMIGFVMGVMEGGIWMFGSKVAFQEIVKYLFIFVLTVCFAWAMGLKDVARWLLLKWDAIKKQDVL